MVMYKKRFGFTLIELIVAIVVISITLMSIPMLLSQANKSDEFSLNQEAILAGMIKMGNILSYPWDEKLVNSEKTKYILDVTNGDSELDRYSDANSTRRIGNFKSKFRRKFYTDETNASVTLGYDKGNEFDDIDDFNGISTHISGNGGGDYIRDFNLTTTVNYISDQADYNSTTLTMDINTATITPTTNIKMVEVNVLDNKNNELITTFRAFSSNIGSYELLYKEFN